MQAKKCKNFTFFTLLNQDSDSVCAESTKSQISSPKESIYTEKASHFLSEMLFFELLSFSLNNNCHRTGKKGK